MSTPENPTAPQADREKQAQASKRSCTGTTKTGTPCQAHPLKDADTCLAHSDQETRGSISFGGKQPGGGRPRKPRAVDIWRAKVEAEADQWWSVLTDARSAQRGVVVGDGEHARVEYVDDHPTRLKAFKEAMDRVFGKPMQYVDVTGRTDESEVDREIAQLLGEMDARDPERKDVAKANGRVHA